MAVVAVQSLWRSSGFVESEQEGKNLERQYILRAPGSAQHWLSTDGSYTHHPTIIRMG
jgi:hypothetical protein